MSMLIRLAQRQLICTLNRRTNMHAHTGTFPTNSVYSIITSTRLEFDTDVPPIAVLAQAEILRNLPNLLLIFIWRLVCSSTTPGPATTSRPSPATLVTTTLAHILIWVHGLPGLNLSWRGVLFKLFPSGWDKVDI